MARKFIAALKQGMQEARPQMQEARLALLANQCGFTVKDGTIRPRRNFTKLTEMGAQDAIPLAGAVGEVLDGNSVKQSLKTTAASVALLGPLGFVGGGREIAVMVTGADGGVIVGTTSKKNLVAAHRFCGALAQYA